jgi:hypothetical protein
MGEAIDYVMGSFYHHLFFIARAGNGQGSKKGPCPLSFEKMRGTSLINLWQSGPADAALNLMDGHDSGKPDKARKVAEHSFDF